MDRKVSINWFLCCSLYGYRRIVLESNKTRKHEWAQINKIQSQYRHTKRKIRRCVLYALFYYRHSICNRRSLSLSLCRSLVHNDSLRFSRIFCVHAESTVIWAYVMRDDCKMSRRFLFLSRRVFSLPFHISDAIIHNGYCIFVIIRFFLASFRVFSLPLAYPFVLLHCRFMLSVMAENHFLHEAWNGGIQIKWFISVEELSQRNTPTRWLFLFLQKHELAPKRILYIIGMASIQSAMWKWAKLFATFSIIL